MPRIENDGQAVNEYCELTGNGSSTFDVCLRCAKKHKGKTIDSVGLHPYNGDPSGVVGDDIGYGLDETDDDGHHLLDHDGESCACEICDFILNTRNY